MKFVPASVQLATEIQKVIHFSVVCEHIPSAGRHHGLIPPRREVDDREPGMSQSQAVSFIYPSSRCIGPTMMQSFDHRCDLHAEIFTASVKNSSDATHVRLTLIEPRKRLHSPMLGNGDVCHLTFMHFDTSEYLQPHSHIHPAACSSVSLRHNPTFTFIASAQSVDGWSLSFL